MTPSKLELPILGPRRQRRSRYGAAGLLLTLLLAGLRYFGVWDVSGCALLPLSLAAMSLCVIGLFGARKWPGAIGLAIGLAVTGAIYMHIRRREQGRLFASEYPRLIADMGSALAFMPPTLPPEAEAVRILAKRLYGWMPTPDKYVEVRYVLPVPAAETVLRQATAQTISPTRHVKALDYSHLVARLMTADDGDPSTPLPAAFRSFILASPDDLNVGGVSVNPASGEVVYWLFEF